MTRKFQWIEIALCGSLRFSCGCTNTYVRSSSQCSWSVVEQVEITARVGITKKIGYPHLGQRLGNRFGCFSPRTRSLNCKLSFGLASAQQPLHQRYENQKTASVDHADARRWCKGELRLRISNPVATSQLSAEAVKLALHGFQGRMPSSILVNHCWHLRARHPQRGMASLSASSQNASTTRLRGDRMEQGVSFHGDHNSYCDYVYLAYLLTS